MFYLWFQLFMAVTTKGCTQTMISFCLRQFYLVSGLFSNTSQKLSMTTFPWPQSSWFSVSCGPHKAPGHYVHSPSYLKLFIKPCDRSTKHPTEIIGQKPQSAIDTDLQSSYLSFCFECVCLFLRVKKIATIHMWAIICLNIFSVLSLISLVLSDQILGC